MSGNKERKSRDFPRCECQNESFWVVRKPDSLNGLCLHPDESVMIENHKIYNMRTRRLQKSQLKKITAIECSLCSGLASDETIKEIIEVAEIILNEEWKKYNVR